MGKRKKKKENLDYKDLSGEELIQALIKRAEELAEKSSILKKGKKEDGCGLG
jgi:hypothetical protein